MTTRAPSIGVTLIWLFGPVVWAVHFFLLYGIATVLCAGPEASQPGLVRLLALGVTVLALAAIACFVALQFIGGRSREAHRLETVRAFLRVTGMTLAGLAAVGIVWTAAGTILIPACTNSSG
jgi:hypothetical protein